MENTMEISSLSTRALLAALSAGVRSTSSGEIVGVKGNTLSLVKAPNGYYRFSFFFEGRKISLCAHKLVALQLYGVKGIGPGMVVRHLNGIPTDNSFTNITIGTYRDNSYDIPPEVRKRSSEIASSKIKRFKEEDIAKIFALRSQGLILKDIAKELHTGKGHISMILNKKLYNGT
jgi:hypothetical protein